MSFDGILVTPYFVLDSAGKTLKVVEKLESNTKVYQNKPNSNSIFIISKHIKITIDIDIW